MKFVILNLIILAPLAIYGAEVGRGMKTNDFAAASLTATNPLTPSLSSDSSVIKSEDTKKEEPKSAVKPEDLDKARTHSLGLGLQGIIESIKDKLSHTNIYSGAYPVPVIHQQPIATHYIQQQPLSYYQSYPSAAQVLPISSPSHLISSPTSYYSSPANLYSSQANLYSSPAHLISSPVISPQPTLNYLSSSAITHQVPVAPIGVSQTTVSRPLVSYNNHIIQKPAYAISSQVIHKPVYTEIQEVIHKPVYTEVQEVIHKPILTELQQVVKRPLYTEHVVKKPLYNSVHQELVDRPLQLQTEQYHVVAHPYSQVIQLPQQILQPYTNHVVQTPVYHQQAITSTSYHVPAPAAAAHITSSIPTALNYAPYSSPLTYLNHWSPSAASSLHIGTPALSSLPISSPAISASPVISSAGWPSWGSSGLSVGGGYPWGAASGLSVGGGYPWGASGALIGGDDYHYGYLSESLCRAQGGCGGRRAADGSEFYQPMYGPQFENFPSSSPVYGIPSQTGGGSFVPMPYSFPQQMRYQPISEIQPADQQPKAEKASGAKSAEEEASTGDSGDSGDSVSSYLVPAESQGQEYLKAAMKEEEKNRDALKGDIKTLEEIAKKIGENPEAMEKIREVISKTLKS